VAASIFKSSQKEWLKIPREAGGWHKVAGVLRFAQDDKPGQELKVDASN